MNRNITLKITLLTSAAAALQGCVAAVVPLAAGGLLGGAAPNYQPGSEEPAPAIVDGTVEVQRSQAAVQQQPESGVAQAVVEADVDEALSGETGLAEEALAGVTAPAAVPEPESEAPSVSAVEPPATFAASEDVKEVEQSPGAAAPDPLAIPARTAPTVADMSKEPQAALAVADTVDTASMSMTETLSEQVLDAPAPDASAPAEFAAAHFDAQISEVEPDLGAAPVEEPIPVPALTAKFAIAPGSDAMGPQNVDPTALAAASPDPEPASANPVQLLDVDSGVNFADSTIDATSVSAADAAAALTALPAAEEPVASPTNLARAAPVVAGVPEPDLPVSAEPVAELAVSSAPAPVSNVEPAIAVVSEAPSVPETLTEPDSRPMPSAPENIAAAVPVEAPVSVTEPATALRPETPRPNAITSLLSYANQREFVSGQNRESAMLANRFSLQPDRAPCGGIQPTVLIDLDPKGNLFLPDQAANPPAGLGVGLEQLRRSGVEIAWISGNSESEENAIRAALTRTALDIFGRDTLLLVRGEDDLKQTLREELAQSKCLIAIAGDERADFDDLYEYLLDPNDAASLEILYDEGWFLIPQPLDMRAPNS